MYVQGARRSESVEPIHVFKDYVARQPVIETSETFSKKIICNRHTYVCTYEVYLKLIHFFMV